MKSILILWNIEYMINVEAKYFLLEYIYMVPHFDSGGRHSVNQNSTEHSRASAWMEWRRHRLYISPAICAWILHVYIKNHQLQFYVKKVGKTCTSCECVRACVSEYRTIKNKKVYHPWHTWIVIIQRERDGTVRNRVVVRSCIRSFVSMYILIDTYTYIYISVY